MAHPFEKIFLDALKQSTELDNVVLEKAEEIIEKGYQKDEVAKVLAQLAKGLIDTHEVALVQEAYEAVEATI